MRRTLPLSQESVEAGCPCAAAAAVTTAEASRPPEPLAPRLAMAMAMGMAALVAMLSEGECCGLLLARSDTLCRAHRKKAHRKKGWRQAEMRRQARSQSSTTSARNRQHSDGKDSGDIIHK